MLITGPTGAEMLLHLGIDFWVASDARRASSHKSSGLAFHGVASYKLQLHHVSVSARHMATLWGISGHRKPEMENLPRGFGVAGVLFGVFWGFQHRADAAIPHLYPLPKAAFGLIQGLCPTRNLLPRPEDPEANIIMLATGRPAEFMEFMDS